MAVTILRRRRLKLSFPLLRSSTPLPLSLLFHTYHENDIPKMDKVFQLISPKSFNALLPESLELPRSHTEVVTR